MIPLSLNCKSTVRHIRTFTSIIHLRKSRSNLEELTRQSYNETNSDNSRTIVFKKEIIDHEIMHCSCSVQSLIPGGTDTELASNRITSVRKERLCTFDLFYHNEKEQSHDTKTEYII